MGVGDGPGVRRVSVGRANDGSDVGEDVEGGAGSVGAAVGLGEMEGVGEIWVGVG